MRGCWLLLVVAMAFTTASAADTIPHQIARTGFALEQPTPQAARRGAYGRTVLTIYSPRLVYWVDAEWLQSGDRLVLTLKGPDGGIMTQRDLKMDVPGRFFIFAAANRPPLGWKRGSYIGEVQVVRGDLILELQTNQIALP